MGVPEIQIDRECYTWGTNIACSLRKWLGHLTPWHMGDGTSIKFITLGIYQHSALGKNRQERVNNYKPGNLVALRQFCRGACLCTYPVSFK